MMSIEPIRSIEEFREILRRAEKAHKKRRAKGVDLRLIEEALSGCCTKGEEE